MKIKRSWLASGIFVASVFVALSNNGCGDDDDGDSKSTQTGHKGEACQTSRDCAPGLVCVPRIVTTTTAASSTSGGSSAVVLGGGGTCVVGVFNVAPTGKECAITECDTTEDCCKNINADSPTCQSYKEECGGPNPPTTPGLCDYYFTNCVCDPNRVACDTGKCITKCVDDTACKFGGPTGSGGKCVGGKCSQCSTDTDCKPLGDDQTCVNGECKAPCKGDGDCPGFDRCVAGKCIEGGCQSSRECVGFSGNVEATCGTDGKCKIPCQTDLECGNPQDFSFMACINNQCTYLGCESDKDCRLQYLGTSTSTSDRLHYSCRDKGLPGNIVR